MGAILWASTPPTRSRSDTTRSTTASAPSSAPPPVRSHWPRAWDWPPSESPARRTPPPFTPRGLCARRPTATAATSITTASHAPAWRSSARNDRRSEIRCAATSFKSGPAYGLPRGSARWAGQRVIGYRIVDAPDLPGVAHARRRRAESVLEHSLVREHMDLLNELASRTIRVRVLVNTQTGESEHRIRMARPRRFSAPIAGAAWCSTRATLPTIRSVVAIYFTASTRTRDLRVVA